LDAVAHLIIAIDGPAASGKTTVARALARRLRFAYVNSGALYRAATWFVIEREISPADSAACVQALSEARIECAMENGAFHLRFNGVDPELFLRESRIVAQVSTLASQPEVRALLTARLRCFAMGQDTVMEGRDIGSAVFPDTPYKFYIDASQEVRERRRWNEAGGANDQIAARDRQDSTRRASPLVIAEDAHVIDSSHLTVEGVVGEMIGRLKLKGLMRAAEAA
jgi:cytidylate kinase